MSIKVNQEKLASQNQKVNHINLAREKIRSLVEVYYDIQDVRMRADARLRQIGERIRGVDPKLLRELEGQIKKYISFEIEDVPVFKEFLKNIKGLGPILCGALLAYFDPRKAQHASGFWKYAGLHVENGKAVKRKKGQRIDYNPKVKVLCWRVGDSFLKQRTPFYREIYDEAKIEETRKLNDPVSNPENCPMFKECSLKLRGRAKRLGREPKGFPCKLHIHFRAMRKMVKRFLADFWIAWRTLEGLKVSESYAVTKLGHSPEPSPYLPRPPRRKSEPYHDRAPESKSEPL